MSAYKLLRVLTSASEKAAAIARHIRNEPQLLALLIQEKTGEQKNERFAQDFKTLADVLIQETIKHVIKQQLPELCNAVYGEEDGRFTNVLGECVTVEIKDSAEETANILYKVLNKNEFASKALADVVHSPVSLTNITEKGADKLQSLYPDISKLAVWIDPIDATGEYIKGNVGSGLDPSIELSASGLNCVTVLLGVFNVDTGKPVCGIINQPFHSFDAASKRWQGKLYWGYAGGGDLDIHSDSIPPLHGDGDKERDGRPICLLSKSASAVVAEKLSSVVDIVYVSGAGYKLLCVCLGLADMYLLTSSNVYQWDTCAPHAILAACTRDGKVLSYGAALAQCAPSTDCELRYGTQQQNACHKEGLLAYRRLADASKILACLKGNTGS